MHSWFDVLQDKGDSPYFTVDEKTQFLNRAQTKFVNEVLNKSFLVSGGKPEGQAIPYNTMDSIQLGEAAIRPLIGELKSDNSYVYNKFPNLFHSFYYSLLSVIKISNSVHIVSAQPLFIL